MPALHFQDRGPLVMDELEEKNCIFPGLLQNT